MESIPKLKVGDNVVVEVAENSIIYSTIYSIIHRKRSDREKVGHFEYIIMGRENEMIVYADEIREPTEFEISNFFNN